MVDYEEQLLAIGAAHLASVGYSVLQAGRGEQAIEMFADKCESIDLVILDLSMPGMGGSKCLEKMLALDPDVKVVISSGYARDGALQDSLAEKISGLLTKPFSRTEMLTMVRRALDRV